MNKVILSGNLTKDPELKTTMNGTKVCSACVAVQREYKEQDGTYTTDFINFVAWRGQADYLTSYGHKGDRIELVGRWQTRSYENANGQSVRVDEVQVESLSVFSKKPQEVDTSDLKEIDGDLPF